MISNERLAAILTWAGDPNRDEKAEIEGKIGAPTPEEIYDLAHDLRSRRINEDHVRRIREAQIAAGLKVVRALE